MGNKKSKNLIVNEVHKLRRVLQSTASFRPSKRKLRLYCWNAGYRLAGAGDGLPIPPMHLIFLATTGKMVARFLYAGKLCADSIDYTLRKNGYRLDNLESILDFGCGCGRVMRHWQSRIGPEYHGCDCNEGAIRWCQKNLWKLAEFKVNSINPPLEYRSEKFDLIYAISVFTHLPEDFQHLWIGELGRVLKSSGLLLITVHGMSRFHCLTADEQEAFLSGSLIVREGEKAGSNQCAAYHPEVYVQDHLAQGFEIVDFLDVGARDCEQDIYLFRKKPDSYSYMGNAQKVVYNNN